MNQKTILQGIMEGNKRRGRQKKRWKTILKSEQEWTLPAQLGQLKQDKVERTCCEFICGAPTTFKGYGIE